MKDRDRKEFQRLLELMDPEAHYDDGLTVTQIRARHNELMRKWRLLEKKVGREVTEEDICDVC